MSVIAECPSCAQKYKVPDAKIGEQARCKSCGHTFTVSIRMDETRIPVAKSLASPIAEAAWPPGTGSLRARDSVSSPLFELGSYIVQRQLGAGGMGVVYLAHDPALRRDVAIKVLPAAIAQDPELLERFLHEARSAAKLHHPNAVIIHQASVHEGRPFIVMELVEGQSLDKTVAQSGALEWRAATTAIRDAAAGLAAAHEIGLVHRDIKPANLMRTSKGVTKVVDFGLARDVTTNEHLTQAGTFLGTPAFMAPEQWTHDTVDARTDLYALICTYYYLLTRQVPFDAPSLPALGYQHRYEPFPDPSQLVPDLPPEISRLISRGTQKEPANRFQNARELIAALEGLIKTPNETSTSTSGFDPQLSIVVQSSRVRPRDASRIRASWRKSRRSMAISGAATTVIVLLGIILLIFAVNGTVTNEPGDPKARVSVNELAGAAAPGLERRAGSWVPLFNGKDLTGWTPMKTTGTDDDIHLPTQGGWDVSNGELICTANHFGWLKSNRQYADFELQLEFKLLPGGNSGVYVRTPDSGHLSLLGMEIQLLDEDSPNHRSIPAEQRTGAVWNAIGPHASVLRPVEMWNEMTIRCEGPGIQVSLNGRQIIDAAVSKYPALENRRREGFIGLSNYHGQAVGTAFRNIRINELTPPVELVEKSANPEQIMRLFDREWIQNPSCEEPFRPGQIPGWSDPNGGWFMRRGKAWHGEFFFHPPPVVHAELSQNISVADLAGPIDDGEVEFQFTGYVVCYNDGNKDTSRIIIEVRDKLDEVLNTFDSGKIRNTRAWEEVRSVFTAPKGTRWIRIRLISTRDGGQNNDGYYDALSLKAVRLEKPATDSKKDEIGDSTPQR